LKDEFNLKPRDLVVHINSKDGLSIAKQAELLGISRGVFYYRPKEADPFTLSVMNEIDLIYTKRPYYGSRKIAKEISRKWELPINRKRVQRLMGIMGLEAIYPKPNLSRNDYYHAVYPYLLKGVKAQSPNHIWGTNITYIRLEKGFLYLVAFMDWFSRFILSWKLSTTLTIDFVIDAAKEAKEEFGTPDITNSDQGVQFTSQDYLSVWDKEKTKISMDSRGRAMDNIFTERFWRSLKYEEVYLKNYASVSEAYQGISSYIKDYNYDRINESLNYKTPAEIYYQKRR